MHLSKLLSYQFIGTFKKLRYCAIQSDFLFLFLVVSFCFLQSFSPTTTNPFWISSPSQSRDKRTVSSKILARRKAQRHHRNVIRSADASLYLTLRLMTTARRTKLDIRNIKLRSICKSNHYFNINIYSDEVAIRDFRFRGKNIGLTTSAIGWVQGEN